VVIAASVARVQFATSLAREVRTEGIRVSVIALAAVNTHFAVPTARFGDRRPGCGIFIEPNDIAHPVVTVLQQP
jgi:NADP-dependent 3-hydroxy acid dehydrogenase YdfG